MWRLLTCPGVIARKGLTSLIRTSLLVVTISTHFRSGFVCWKRKSHSNTPSCRRGWGTEWIQCGLAAKKNCTKSAGWFVPDAWKNKSSKQLIEVLVWSEGSLILNITRQTNYKYQLKVRYTASLQEEWFTTGKFCIYLNTIIIFP